MPKRIQKFSSDDVVVSYDVARCIHAAECVHGLPGVFNPNRRPWIDPSAGRADEIAEVVARCPTGALSFRRSDGGSDEVVPDRNTVTVAANGPLYVNADMELQLAGRGDGVANTRAALCRCGGSKNRPYCDNSHKEMGFEDPGDVDTGRSRVEPQAAAETVVITLSVNGPLLFRGPVAVCSADGRDRAHMTSVALCRCGESLTKPFCDGTHKSIGFEAE